MLKPAEGAFRAECVGCLRPSARGGARGEGFTLGAGNGVRPQDELCVCLGKVRVAGAEEWHIGHLPGGHTAAWGEDALAPRGSLWEGDEGQQLPGPHFICGEIPGPCPPLP